MESIYQPFKRSRIHVLRFGEGPRTAICLHGYGETAETFAFLEKEAGHLFTFYAIDLPFHGQTDWQDPAPTPEDLEKLINELTDRSSADSGHRRSLLTAHHSPFTLIGFSLGGRVALSLYQVMPEQVHKLVLLAPDGLKLNFWYWLSTQTWLGNRLFSLTMKKPHWFLGFLKTMNKWKLVNASIFKFVNYYIGDEQVRRQLYQRWTGLRLIRPSQGPIKKYIKQENTPVELVYGRFDRIILSSVGERFRKGIEAQVNITLLNGGHQVLQEKHMADLMKILQS